MNNTKVKTIVKTIVKTNSIALITFTIIGMVSLLNTQGHSQTSQTGVGSQSPQGSNQTPRAALPQEVELANLDIPEINAKILVPTSWNIWTILEARAAVEKIKYPSQEAKNLALEGAQRTGSDNIRISRHLEPYDGINPTLTIAWSPISSAEINKVPKEAQSEVCARTLKNTILPKLTEFSKSIKVIEQPTPIDNKGSGAWVTIAEVVNLKNNPSKDLEVINRIYLLLSPRHFILVTVTFSNKDDKEAETNKQILGEIMKSFSLLNPQ